MHLPYKRLTACLNMLLILTLLISLLPPLQPAAAATIELAPMNEAQAFSPNPVEPAANELTNEVKRLSVQNEIEATSIPPSSLSPQSSSAQSGLMFIENVGQFDAKARFMVRGGEGSLYLAADALWLTFLEPITPPNRSRFANESRGVGLDHQLPISGTRRGVNLKVSFPGANPHPRLEPFNRLDTKVSYFIGNDPAGWRPDVPVWGGVRYVDLYPGLDLEVTGENGRLVQRLVVRNIPPPLSSPPGEAWGRAVRLRIEGADTLQVNGNRLQVSTAVGDVTLPLLQPVRGDGNRLSLPIAPPSVKDRDITAPFAPAATASLSPASLPTRSSAGLAAPLPAGIQSPLQDGASDLLYSTFLGGNSGEDGYGIAVDGSGNAYVTGETSSTDFPTTVGAFETNYQGGFEDVFVAKVDTLGTGGDYVTFIGGSQKDSGHGIVVNETGQAYITGQTHSSNFPPSSNAYQNTFNNNGACSNIDSNACDAFVVKLNTEGTELTYSTFLGGDGGDLAHAIAIDNAGNIFVVGSTTSANFPTTPTSFDPTYNGGSSSSFDGDGFIAKLNSDGTALFYGAYLGGQTDNDYILDVAVDGAGNAFVAGYTESSDFPATTGADDGDLSGNEDGFVAKINPDGTSLIYATYLGGNDYESGQAIAVNEMGNAYVTGTTASLDFPKTTGAYDQTLNDGFDGFAVKVNAAGTDLEYATFLGGAGSTEAGGIALDGEGNVYATGVTYSSSPFSTTPNAFEPDPPGGFSDIFVAKLDSGGTELNYGTFLGGSNNENGHDIAVDEAGNVYVTGYTHSSDFTLTPNAYDPIFSSAPEAFLTKLGLGDSCTPPGLLTDIGQAVATVVQPAQGDCGSTFEELITIPPYPEKLGYNEDGTYAFVQFANAIREAKYEVDFTALEWHTKFQSGSPGDIMLDGLKDLYGKVLSDTLQYPQGIKIRFLMGDHVNHQTKEDLLAQITASDRNIPIYLPLSNGKLWQIEVADYPVYGVVEGQKTYVPNFRSALKWGHVKVLIVDGETVIAGGYNVDDEYILVSEENTSEWASQKPEDVWRDMGMKLSGEIAQDTLKMFDHLWEGSTVCLDFDETQGVCTDVEIAGPPVHVPKVLIPPLAGGGVNVFSLFRDANDRTGELGIFEAMSASRNKLRLIQDRVLFVQGFRPRPLYVQGIHNALDNGSKVKYITDPWGDKEVWNITSFCDMRLEYALQHPFTPFIFEAKAAGVYIHTKSIAVDDQMLIVGSSNMGQSSWHSPPLWYNGMDLAEYNLAVDDPGVAQQYDDYFETLWNSPSASYIDCSLLEKSLRSIQSIVDEAQPYDIVVLPEGIHQESVVIDKPLHILGMSGKRTVIEPPAGQPAFHITSSGVSIRDLTVSDSTEYGIELDGNTGSSLENIQIRRVLFENNDSGAIWAHDSPINYVIENNTFIGGAQGIRLDVSEQTGVSSTVRNNIFYGQTVVPIKIDSATDGSVEYSYNLFDNCNRAVDETCPPNWYEGTLSSVSSIHDNLLNLDPEFDTATGYYTLLPGSPAIDAGDPSTQNETGLDGYTPQRADIGAFETELMLDPDDPFRETGGLVVMEAEHYIWNFNRSGPVWKTYTGLPGETGPGHISVQPDVDLQLDLDAVVKPQLDYTINFTTTGTYHIWLRGYAPNAAGDSVYVGMDDQPVATLSGFAPRIWSWAKDSVQEIPVTFEITQPGEHVFHLWMREDGLRLDRIILTTNSNYQPTANGPAESQRAN